MSTVVGCDVSEWQGRPNWNAARQDGIGFAVARVFFGLEYLDKDYAYNRDHIEQAGIVGGAYAFLRSRHSTTGTRATSAKDSARRQADLFLRLAPEHWLHAVDVEYMPDVARYGRLAVDAFAAEYRAHYPTHPLLVYTGRDLWRSTVQPSESSAGASFGPLWSAGDVPNHYAGACTPANVVAALGSHSSGVPYGGWSRAAIIQVSDKGRVAGIAGNVDLDVFSGTSAQMHALTGATSPPPPPPPPGSVTTVYGVLRQGDTDARTQGSVSVVQRQVGHGTTVDGTFGAQTVTGVKNYQARHGLAADGEVGGATVRAFGPGYRYVQVKR